jgi:hypothetical protein
MSVVLTFGPANGKLQVQEAPVKRVRVTHGHGPRYACIRHFLSDDDIRKINEVKPAYYSAINVLKNALNRFLEHMLPKDARVLGEDRVTFLKSLEVRTTLENEKEPDTTRMHTDGPGSDGFNIIVALSEPVAHTKIYTHNYGNDDYEIKTCDGGVGSATYFSMDTLHAAPHTAGRVVMTARWKFNEVIPDELERAAAFNANEWVDPGPSTEPTHACIQNFLSQTEIDAIKTSGIHSNDALRILRQAADAFCDHMWGKMPDGRERTFVDTAEIRKGTETPLEARSRIRTALSFRAVSVSLTDATDKHHQTYKLDQFGSEKTEDESCLGGFGTAIMIPEYVSVRNITDAESLFFEFRVLYLGDKVNRRFTLEEKNMAEAYRSRGQISGQ